MATHIISISCSGIDMLSPTPFQPRHAQRADRLASAAHRESLGVLDLISRAVPHMYCTRKSRNNAYAAMSTWLEAQLPNLFRYYNQMINDHDTVPSLQMGRWREGGILCRFANICNRSFWTKWRLLLAQLPGYHFGGTMGLVRSSCKSMSIRLFWNITMWKIETPWVSPLPWAPLKSGGRYDKKTHRGLLRLMSHWRPSSFRLQLYPSWTLLLWRPYKSWCLAKYNGRGGGDTRQRTGTRSRTRRRDHNIPQPRRGRSNSNNHNGRRKHNHYHRDKWKKMKVSTIHLSHPDFHLALLPLFWP